MNRKFMKDILFFILPLVSLISCKKLTQVAEPIDTTTTEETFSSDAAATSAVLGIYNDLLTATGGGNGNASFGFGNGFTTVGPGMSADELRMTWGPSEYETNTLTARNGGYFWVAPYRDVYLSNAAIEGLTNSKTVSAGTKDQLMGEAKFFRAFCHFYLVNFNGDIPYLTTTAYAINDTTHRTPSSLVYQLIIKDLTDAQSLLIPDYSFVPNNERVRVNKFAATALLARTYLYNKDWAKAEEQASAVIGNTDLYHLESDLNAIFLKESREAILQWQTYNGRPYATFEGYNILPPDDVDPPNYNLTEQLVNDFEEGDLRRKEWVDSMDYYGTLYYYPYKYKVYVGTKDNINEYYTILRLAEQYLIRAEARAQQSKLEDAVADLNVIRERAQLPPLPSTLNQDEVLAAVAHERRIELFAEWGHRWLDLKRTGQADAVLGYKPNWKTTAQLYPIPASELINNGNLVQNPGY